MVRAQSDGVNKNVLICQGGFLRFFRLIRIRKVFYVPRNVKSKIKIYYNINNLQKRTLKNVISGASETLARFLFANAKKAKKAKKGPGFC
jgi:hypothetical protein